jgi:hypothetical protein
MTDVTTRRSITEREVALSVESGSRNEKRRPGGRLCHSVLNGYLQLPGLNPGCGFPCWPGEHLWSPAYAVDTIESDATHASITEATSLRDFLMSPPWIYRVGPHRGYAGLRQATTRLS